MKNGLVEFDDASEGKFKNLLQGTRFTDPRRASTTQYCYLEKRIVTLLKMSVGHGNVSMDWICVEIPENCL